MATLRKLTRRDLKTFDDFATEAVLTAMDLGGVGRITRDGHARIRGKNATITIARDTTAPHCQGNVAADLKRAFPELRTNGATEKITAYKDRDGWHPVPAQEDAMTSDSNNTSTGAMVECPARGCPEKFPTLGEANAHVHAEHSICKWQGCNFGPDGGPFVGISKQSIGGHVNTRHKGFKLNESNPKKAATNRAATYAAKKKAKAGLNGGEPNRRPAAPDVPSPEQLRGLEGHQTSTDERPEKLAPPTMEPPVVTSTDGLHRLMQEPSVLEQQAAVPAESDAEATLVLIRELLTEFFGEDPEVPKLKKKVAALKEQLAFVRDAAGLDFGDDEEDSDS